MLSTCCVHVAGRRTGRLSKKPHGRAAAPPRCHVTTLPAVAPTHPHGPQRLVVLENIVAPAVGVAQALILPAAKVKPAVAAGGRGGAGNGAGWCQRVQRPSPTQVPPSHRSSLAANAAGGGGPGPSRRVLWVEGAASNALALGGGPRILGAVQAELAAHAGREVGEVEALRPGRKARGCGGSPQISSRGAVARAAAPTPYLPPKLPASPAPPLAQLPSLRRHPPPGPAPPRRTFMLRQFSSNLSWTDRRLFSKSCSSFSSVRSSAALVQGCGVERWFPHQLLQEAGGPHTRHLRSQLRPGQRSQPHLWWSGYAPRHQSAQAGSRRCSCECSAQQERCTCRCTALQVCHPSQRCSAHLAGLHGAAAWGRGSAEVARAVCGPCEDGRRITQSKRLAPGNPLIA